MAFSVSMSAASPRRWHAVALLAPLAALVAALLTPPAPAAAATGTPTTYQGHVYASVSGSPSADKPQSKLWYHDGAWWALMLNSAGRVTIHELRSDHVWRDTGTVVDSRKASTGDALWSNGKLYVASRTGGSTGQIQVSRFSYSSGTRKYTRDSGFPVKPGGSGGTESVTVDRDSLGKLWISFTRASKVWVAHSTTSDTAWTKPFRIPGVDTDVSADDISAVVAMQGKIGVMWSDQASNTFRFAVHADGASDSSWTFETPLAGTNLADDHLNLKSLLEDDSGRVHAAVKTSLTGSSDPSIVVLSRSSTGTWTNAVAATVKENLTRPQLALDRTNRQLFVLQSTEGGGTVYYKTAPLSSISFGPGTGAPFTQWSGAKINNVSTTKQAVDATTGLVGIATDQGAKRYYHTELPLGSTAPDPGDTTAPTVTSVRPADGATGVAVTTGVEATFSEAMDPATVNATTFTLTGPSGATSGTVTYDSASATARLAPASALAADATYTATVTTGARDVAGNALASPKSWSFTTAAASGGTQTVTLTATADSYVQDTTPSRNYGTAALLSVDASPRATSYLKFDLAPYAGRSLQSVTLKVRATTSGSTGSQNVKLVADDSWSESTLTYKNRPGVGSVVGTLGPTAKNTSYSVPLDPGSLQSELGQALSLGMDTGSTDGLDLGSRETSTPPQLVLVLG